MRTTLAIALHGLLLLWLAPAPAHGAPQRRTARQTHRTGTSQFGASLQSEALGEHAGSTGKVQGSVNGRATIAGRTYRAFAIEREVEARDLGGRTRTQTTTLVEIGPSSFRVEVSIARRVRLARFALPVPVGPFRLTLSGDVAVAVSVGGFARGSGTQAEVGLTGTGSVAGTLSVGIGQLGVQVGVEGVLDLIAVRLPVSATLRAAAIQMQVRLELESTLRVRVFAKVGGAKWSYDVPQLQYRLARRTHSIASWTLRGA